MHKGGWLERVPIAFTCQAIGSQPPQFLIDQRQQFQGGLGIAFGGGLLVYGALKAFVGIRLDAEDEFNGTDLTIHKISASAERETLW